MIKHSLKLIWNQRKKNTYLIIELFLIFVLLFLNGTYLIEKGSYYLEGVGANVEDVTYIRLEKKTPITPNDLATFNALKNELREMKTIENVSLNYRSTPYTYSMQRDKVKAGKHQLNCRIQSVDDDYQKIFQSPITAGDWFTAKDTNNRIAPALITEKTANYLFANESPLNKRITINRDEFRIVGVLEKSKRNNYEKEQHAIIIPISRSNWLKENNLSELAIRSYSGQALNIQEVISHLRNYLPAKQYDIRQISEMTQMKTNANRFTKSDILMSLGIMLFLIINMVLGMIGIIGYRVKLRREEMAVRMAMGATAKKVSQQIRVEMYLLCLLSIIPALLMAIQIPLLDLFPVDDSLFYIALGSAILFIYLLVAIAVWYPARSILRIEPALALKEE